MYFKEAPEPGSYEMPDADDEAAKPHTPTVTFLIGKSEGEDWLSVPRSEPDFIAELKRAAIKMHRAYGRHPQDYEYWRGYLAMLRQSPFWMQ